MPIWGAMMGRFLLTLLALLTGIAVQAAPAQAGSGQAESAEVSRFADAAGTIADAEGAALTARCQRVRVGAARAQAHRWSAEGVVAAPGVLTRIDRARE